VDGDGVDNAADNCPSAANPPQGDIDFDGLGDVCDLDLDGDAVANEVDNCVQAHNPDQADFEPDGLGDVCDPDDDNDTVSDDADNCPLAMNAEQLDFDGDGAGDLCDTDADGDGVADAEDACLLTELDDVVSPNGCTLEQRCPCAGPSGQSRAWRNHGRYVSCMFHVASEYRELGLLQKHDARRLVADAARSTCGRPARPEHHHDRVCRQSHGRGHSHHHDLFKPRHDSRR
jgi:hypothetical protein